MREPIVIVGGFGSHWRDYMDGAKALRRITERRVFVADITRVTWPVAGLTSYVLLLDRTHKAVMKALHETGAAKVILVGHSAGGVVARGYLADNLRGLELKRFFAREIKAYNGHERVSRYIALGSPIAVPHGRYAQERRALRYISWINKQYPGAYYPDVQYLSVYGRTVLGKPKGERYETVAHQYYKFLSGEGEQWGDGVVPNTLSRAEGIPSLELPGMGHGPMAHQWYLSDETAIRRWWHYFEVGDPVDGRGDLVHA